MQLWINQELDFFKIHILLLQTFQDKFASFAKPVSESVFVSRYVIDSKQLYAKINISEQRHSAAAYYQQNIAKYNES